MSQLRPWLCVALTVCTLCAGCGLQPAAQSHGTPPAVAAPSPPAPSPPASRTTRGWHLTVYYTPVESYHGPPRVAISDCGGAALGQHSSDFLNHVQTEGFGRAVAPIRGKQYLGWDFDRNCWFMATTPVGALDRPLRAWASTAAPDSLAPGVSVRVVSCGADVEADVCTHVQGAAWIVDDRCAGGCTDPQHLDLYIGEEDRPDFENQSPSYFETHDAVVTLTG